MVSASNIFLGSMQTLQSCQQMKGVLGGAIFYNNKVLHGTIMPMCANSELKEIAETTKSEVMEKFNKISLNRTVQ